jgi:hypothetical protein
MSLEFLRGIVPFVYLATPYSKYPAGQEAAYRDASTAAAELVRQNIPVFCPIAHTHPIAVYGNIDLLDLSIWLPADKPFIDLAGAIAVVQMEGWYVSNGITHEIATFRRQSKPIFKLAWPNLDVVQAEYPA